MTRSKRKGGPRREISKPVSAGPVHRSRLLIVLALPLVLAGLVWYGIHRPVPSAPRAPAADRLNLLLITLDTTRADRLGCYGYARARTRYLDRLAAEGVRFEQALSPAPITRFVSG